MEKQNSDLDRIRTKAHDQAFHSFGKAYIFEQRGIYYNRMLRFLTVLGILAPVLIGATVIGYGIDIVFLKELINVAALLAIFQVALSTISMAYNWSDNLSYAFESAQSHYHLCDRFKQLGEFPPEDFKEAFNRFELINTQLKARVEQDTKHQIKDGEYRMGMRYALREYKKPCVKCEIVPTSMEPTDCPVCGDFKKPLINRL